MTDAARDHQRIVALLAERDQLIAQRDRYAGDLAARIIDAPVVLLLRFVLDPTRCGIERGVGIPLTTSPLRPTRAAFVGGGCPRARR